MQNPEGSNSQRFFSMTHGEVGFYDKHVMKKLLASIVENKLNMEKNPSAMAGTRRSKSLTTRRNGDAVSQLTYIRQNALDEEEASLPLTEQLAKVDAKLAAINSVKKKLVDWERKHPVHVINKTCTIDRIKTLIKVFDIAADDAKYVTTQSAEEKSKQNQEKRELMAKRFIQILRRDGTEEAGADRAEESMSLTVRLYDRKVANFLEKMKEGRLILEKKELEDLIAEDTRAAREAEVQQGQHVQEELLNELILDNGALGVGDAALEVDALDDEQE